MARHGQHCSKIFPLIRQSVKWNWTFSSNNWTLLCDMQYAFSQNISSIGWHFVRQETGCHLTIVNSRLTCQTVRRYFDNTAWIETGRSHSHYGLEEYIRTHVIHHTLFLSGGYIGMQKYKPYHTKTWRKKITRLITILSTWVNALWRTLSRILSKDV